MLLGARPALAWIVLAALLMTFSQSTFESIFALWAKAGFGLGPRSVGLMMGVLAIMLILMQGGLVRWLAPRLGEHRLAIAGIGTYVIGALLIAAAHSVDAVLVGFVFCGLGVGAFIPCGILARLARGGSVRSWRGDGRISVGNFAGARARALQRRHRLRAPWA